MGIDKFGRAISSEGAQPSHSSPLTFGYVLTSDGNIDVQKKRICNLAKPLNPEDAVTKEFVDETFNALKGELRKNVYFLEKKIESLAALSKRLNTSGEITNANKSLPIENNDISDVSHKPQPEGSSILPKSVGEQLSNKKLRTS